MVAKEFIVKYKPISSKSYKLVLKATKDRKVKKCIWNQGELTVIFEDFPREVFKELTIEEVAFILNRIYLTPGSLFYEAQKKMSQNNLVVFERTNQWR